MAWGDPKHFCGISLSILAFVYPRAPFPIGNSAVSVGCSLSIIEYICALKLKGVIHEEEVCLSVSHELF